MWYRSSMEISVGWSAEVSSGVWDKTDIKLDRVDFEAMKVEHGLVGLHITQDEVFRLMENEAKRYVAGYIAIGHPDLQQECREKIATMQARRDDIIQSIKNRSLNADSNSETKES